MLSVAVVTLLTLSIGFFALRGFSASAIETTLRESGAGPAVLAERRAALGLDAPLTTQYAAYLLGLLRGDLGVSLLDGQPVAARLAAALPHTLALGTASLLVGSISGALMGAGAALARARWVRWGCGAWIALGLSVPVYWSGTLALFIFSGALGLLPASGTSPAALVLPAAFLGWGVGAAIASETAEACTTLAVAGFVTTAHAKGLAQRTIALGHIGRAALPAVLVIIGVQAGFVFSSSAVTEMVFNRPGVGRLLVDAVLRGDYPVVQGVLVYAAAVFWAARVLAAWGARLADPRLRSDPS